MNPSKTLIRWITPVVWSLFPERKIQAIREFSNIERDSGCQLLRAIDLVEGPELKAYLFQHVLEEFFHADIFDEVRRSLSDLPAAKSTKARHELLKGKVDLQAILKFISYVQVGESAVHRDFREYSRLPVDLPVRAVFSRAGRDEGKHEMDTHNIVVRLSGSEQNANALLNEASQTRFLRRWIDAMNSLGSFLLSCILASIYFLFGWMGKRSSRNRIALDRKIQLQLLQQQVKDFSDQIP